MSRGEDSIDRHRMQHGPLWPESGKGVCECDLGEGSAVGAPRVPRERIDSEQTGEQRNGRCLCLQCKALPQGVVRRHPVCRAARVSGRAPRHRQRHMIIPHSDDSVPQR